MHVIDPERYRPRAGRRKRWPLITAPVLLILALGTVNYLRPLPEPVISWSIRAPTAGAKPVLNWPTSAQAAVAAENYGPLDTFGVQTPLAAASTAKVILALCVLQKQPVAPGQAGQMYTVSAADTAVYQAAQAQGGSSLQVIAGERLSEYQALQALMLPSADNIADSLARWVFGGQTAYAAYAGTWLQRHGIDNTHIGNDASGFTPGTTSTASDLTQLGLLAAQNPVLMEIAGQGSVTLPVAGTVRNYDTVLGQSSIDGLKTGSSSADPGAFIFTATAQIGGQPIRISGAVMGAPDLNTALHDGVQLAASAEQGFEQIMVAQRGQTVGTLRTAWGASATIEAAGPVQLVRWKTAPVTLKPAADPRTRNGTVGNLKASAGPDNANTPLRLSRTIPGPTFWWRLTRH